MRRFVFIIDTDSYSGNFERELCGYLTGRYDSSYGEEVHGSAEAAIAKAELEAEAWDYFENHVIDCLEQPDDVPIHTPVVVYPTPGWYNTGGGSHVKGEAPSGKTAWPAYQSVGIFFDGRPSEKIIGMLKGRAQKFAKDYWPKHEFSGHALEVIGFRLLQEVIKEAVSEEKV